MFVKKIIFLLCLINLGYFGYNQVWLANLTSLSERQREPYRVSGQIKPDAIVVKQLSPSTATSSPSPTASNPTPVKDARPVSTN